MTTTPSPATPSTVNGRDDTEGEERSGQVNQAGVDQDLAGEQEMINSTMGPLELEAIWKDGRSQWQAPRGKDWKKYDTELGSPEPMPDSSRAHSAGINATRNRINEDMTPTPVSGSTHPSPKHPNGPLTKAEADTVMENSVMKIGYYADIGNDPDPLEADPNQLRLLAQMRDLHAYSHAIF